MTYIMQNVDSADPYTKTKRGWTESKATAQAYNVNFASNGNATVKVCDCAMQDPDLTGIPERDENDNII